MGVKSVFFTNTQSRFESVVFNSVLGSKRAKSNTRRTVSWYLCSSGSSGQGEVEGPWRAQCQPKKPFKRASEKETRELVGGTKENCVLLNKGSLIYPLGRSMIFFTEQTRMRLI